MVWELCTFGVRDRKKATKRDSLKPLPKTNSKLGVIGKSNKLPKLELGREL